MKKITIEVDFLLPDDVPSMCTVTEKEFCDSIVNTLKEETNRREVADIIAGIVSYEGVEFKKAMDE